MAEQQHIVGTVKKISKYKSFLLEEHDDVWFKPETDEIASDLRAGMKLEFDWNPSEWKDKQGKVRETNWANNIILEPDQDIPDGIFDEETNESAANGNGKPATEQDRVQEAPPVGAYPSKSDANTRDKAIQLQSIMKAVAPTLVAVDADTSVIWKKIDEHYEELQKRLR